MQELRRFNPNPTLNEELAVYAEQDIDHFQDLDDLQSNLNSEPKPNTQEHGPHKPDASKQDAHPSTPDFHKDIKYKYTGEIFSRETRHLPELYQDESVKDTVNSDENKKRVENVKGPEQDKFPPFCLQGLPGNTFNSILSPEAFAQFNETRGSTKLATTSNEGKHAPSLFAIPVSLVSLVYANHAKATVPVFLQQGPFQRFEWATLATFSKQPITKLDSHLELSSSLSSQVLSKSCRLCTFFGFLHCCL